MRQQLARTTDSSDFIPHVPAKPERDRWGCGGICYLQDMSRRMGQRGGCPGPLLPQNEDCLEFTCGLLHSSAFHIQATCEYPRDCPSFQQHHLRGEDNTTSWRVGSGPNEEVGRGKSPSPLSWAHARCSEGWRGCRR